MRSLASRSQGDSNLKGFVSGLLWPLATWPREVLVALYEADFQYVSPQIKAELRDCFSGPGCSIDIENFFNWVRLGSRQHLARRTQRLAKGVHLDSLLLSDARSNPKFE
jgi:hypothetical protein